MPAHTFEFLDEEDRKHVEALQQKLNEAESEKEMRKYTTEIALVIEKARVRNEQDMEKV